MITLSYPCQPFSSYLTITLTLITSFTLTCLTLVREQPLTFLEFNYMLLQAYDFLELSRRYDACLQLGKLDDDPLDSSVLLYTLQKPSRCPNVNRMK